jgi:hypothetical protein
MDDNSDNIGNRNMCLATYDDKRTHTIELRSRYTHYKIKKLIYKKRKMKILSSRVIILIPLEL